MSESDEKNTLHFDPEIQGGLEWIELPANLCQEQGFTSSTTQHRCQIQDQFLAVKCLCDSHPAWVFILTCCPYIVVHCPYQGMLWLRKPNDLKVFKQHMTAIQRKQTIEEIES